MTIALEAYDSIPLCMQVMCSYLATSSALPVLLGHQELIALAADMVHASSTTGKGPLVPVLC